MFVIGRYQFSMKVSKYFKFILGLLIGCVGICTASLTAAWFTYTAQIEGAENELVGSSEGAYYARGRGTPEDPFIINKPRHLYNLAWLQYLGRYNKVDKTTGKVNQTYFAIDPRKDNNDTADYSSWYLDMSGEVLPPIGTETNPFLGNFDGRGYTIKNLTTSNEYGNADGDVKKKPAMVNLTDNQLEGVNIVGTFGVVGDINNKFAGKYDSQILSVKNFDLESVTVNNKLNNSLIGVLAGYVNGSVDDVGIVNSNLDVKTGTHKYSTFPNVSNFSTVGYCEDEYQQKVHDEITTIYERNKVEAKSFTINDEGLNPGWGGSINMKDIYTSIKTNYFDKDIKGTNQENDSSARKNTNLKYISSETVIKDENNLVQTHTTNTTNFPDFSGTRFYNETIKDDNRTVSNLCIGVDSARIYSDMSPYMCLSGYRDRSSSSYINTITTTEYDQNIPFNIFYETNNDKVYLAIDGENIISTTTLSNNCTRHIDENNLIYHRINDSLYYLYFDGQNLKCSTNKNIALAWQVNINNYSNFSTLYSNQNLYLAYDIDNNNFTLLNSLNYTYHENRGFYISYNNYYLRGTANNNSTTGQLTGTNNAANRTIWYFTNGTYGKLYCIINDRNFYIHVGYSYYDGYTISLNTTSTGNDVVSREKGSDYLRGRFSYNYRSYYGYLNVSTTTVYTSRNEQLFTYTFAGNPHTYNANVSPSKLAQKERYTYTTRQNAEIKTPDTYIPLTSKKNNQNLRNDVPDLVNTGYIVSGAQYTTQLVGDIRISSFPNDSLDKSGNNNLTTVYTVNGDTSNTTNDRAIVYSNGTERLKYNNFAKARKDLMEKALDGVSIYGLHFMNAKIGHTYNDGHQVRIDKAIINGKELQNYQVPYDSINFNLKEKGYITFLAGTYYNNTTDKNNSFFSLYQVFRNSSAPFDIQSNGLKKITEIYQPKDETHSFMYKYSDNTYSTPYTFDQNGIKISILGSSDTSFNPNITTANGPSSTKYKNYYNTTAVFKTNWIEKRNYLHLNAAYYFEIPMNDGEFALGSVDGGIGAYLMYLDIGANGMKVNRSIITEKFESIDNTYAFPKGVAILLAAGNTVDDKNSYCIVLNDETSGKVTLSMTSTASVNAGNVTRILADTTKASVSYKPKNLTVNLDGSPTTIVSPIESHITTTQRLTYFDYKVNTQKTIKTTFEQTKVDNGSYSAIEINRYGEDGVLDNTLPIYNHAEGRDSGKPLTQAQINAITIDSTSLTTPIFKFSNYYFDEGDVTITFTTSTKAVNGSNGYYLEVNGYNIQVTFTRRNANSEVIDITDKVTIVQLHNTDTYKITINLPATNPDGTETVNNASWTKVIQLTIPPANNNQNP